MGLYISMSCSPFFGETSISFSRDSRVLSSLLPRCTRSCAADKSSLECECPNVDVEGAATNPELLPSSIKSRWNESTSVLGLTCQFFLELRFLPSIIEFCWRYPQFKFGAKLVVLWCYHHHIQRIITNTAKTAPQLQLFTPVFRKWAYSPTSRCPPNQTRKTNDSAQPRNVKASMPENQPTIIHPLTPQSTHSTALHHVGEKLMRLECARSTLGRAKS